MMPAERMDVDGGRRERGFTLMEALISVSIFSLLVISLFSASLELSSFVSQNQADYMVQSEVNLAFSRLTEILRESGWVDVGMVTYPRVLAGGSELEFKILEDLDGNGYAFDGATGELEWNPKVLTIRRNSSTEVLEVLDGGARVWGLGRFITSIRFATYLEDISLHFREIQVVIEARRNDREGNQVVYNFRGSILMRN